MAQAAKTVVFGHHGGIAAYKACEVASRLKRRASTCMSS